MNVNSVNSVSQIPKTKTISELSNLTSTSNIFIELADGDNHVSYKFDIGSLIEWIKDYVKQTSDGMKIGDYIKTVDAYNAFVKKAGDTMSGQLTIINNDLACNSIKASSLITASRVQTTELTCSTDPAQLTAIAARWS